MLYPDFKELVGLKNKISNSKLLSNRLIKSFITGDYFSPFRGHGLEFMEVRKYVFGDDIRKIDWRVTARTNNPHIKLFTEEKELNVLIIVDMNETMRFGTRGTFKSVQAARCASLIGWYANKNNNRVGALLFGNVPNGMEYLRPSRSKGTLWKMLKNLCRTVECDTHSNTNISLDKAIEFAFKVSSSNTLIFVISDFISVDNKITQQLRYLNTKCQVTLLGINDPSDISLTPSGNILFSADKIHNIYVNTNNLSGRKIYEKQWEDRTLKLKDLSTSLGINYVSLSTNKDVYFDLFYQLQSYARQRKR